MKKRTINFLNLNKKSISQLNTSESRMIRGASGQFLCVPEPKLDTKNPGQCVDNSGLRLCPTDY